MNLAATGSLKQMRNSIIFEFYKDLSDNIVEIRLGSKKDCKERERIG